MTTPSGRTPRGRRDNGLDAAEYAAAADVDPRVGEHLLDVLGLAGIAAYLQPSADLHPVTRTTTLPDRPTDRLFVDRRHLAEARDVIGRLDLGTGDLGTGDLGTGDLGTGDLGTGAEAGSGTAEAASPTDRPGAPPLRRRREDVDVDAAWRDILESWAAPAVEPPAPGLRRGPGTAEPGTGAPGTESTGVGRPAGEAPAGETTTDRTRTDQPRTDQPRTDQPRGDQTRTEDHPVDRPRADENRTDDGPARHEPPRDERRRVPRDAVPRPITGLDVPFDPDERIEDPDDEGFVPPAPPPVPRASRYTVLAMALVLGGLALFLWPALLPVGESTSLVLGVSGILGGFATLVWRLRDGLTDDDDGDDGAIV